MTVNPKLMQRIRQDVQSMHAYAIQDSVGMVKLDAMENPFSLPPELQQALGERLGRLALNRYPDGRVNDLRAALAAYAGMPEGHDIMLGNGSDELISLLAMACDVPGASILAPLPGFVMYAMSAQLQGLAFHGVPLTADFELDEAAMLAAIAMLTIESLLSLLISTIALVHIANERKLKKTLRRMRHLSEQVFSRSFKPKSKRN